MKVRFRTSNTVNFRNDIIEVDVSEFQIIYKTARGKQVRGRYIPAKDPSVLRKEIDRAKLRIHCIWCILNDGTRKPMWASELYRIAHLNQWPLAISR